MKVIKASEDYYIYLAKKEAENISTSIKGQRIGPPFFNYPWCVEKVSLEGAVVEGFDEELAITCTRDAMIADEPGGLTLRRGKDENYPQDVNVRVFTARMLDLIEDKLPYIMTRYDRVESKVWIHIDEFVEATSKMIY